ncbi:Tol-Pal system beta propeller repeat protein TolB [Aliiruegeria sabulilitoris]|uniref:Tol-Pal system beta propeller repeat protein TolB n=1 Tax=Aliiruegeria sabulilitoris TaxID=1510458 RepID=UPI000834D224|nr:Tol-Pal system beta propeller repeat protein TolB [Aliiruegeria sabulilitoris]NDR55971.1 Tol-Pal system protein TolB [Pseudoruegeria sp. M32A2M]
MMFLRSLAKAAVMAVAALLPLALPALAQDRLRIEITEGVIEPLPFAIPTFEAETPQAAQLANDITRVIAADLVGTGLFREVPASAHIARITSFASPVSYPDWKAINVQALITGAVSVDGSGRTNVKFRLHDVFADNELGEGLQLGGASSAARRLAHKVADQVYSRITGEGAYFDSRVVFVHEEGPKNARQKRLGVMDYDGANVQYLTDSSSIVLAPRFSPTGDRVLYTSYSSGVPEIYMMQVGAPRPQKLIEAQGAMTFAPRFGPDGNTVVYSESRGGNTDIFVTSIGGSASKLTNTPSIETAPSYSPDGSQIVFESDRSGTQQLYIMSARGGEAKRISFGEGRYGTPVWSPRGDLIAFTKQHGGRFHIGVMRTDGSEERLLTASFLDEGPTWSPNGRVIMFTRQSAGAGGQPSLYSVDITGRNLRRVPTPGAASDPAWSPLLP